MWQIVVLFFYRGSNGIIMYIDSFTNTRTQKSICNHTTNPRKTSHRHVWGNKSRALRSVSLLTQLSVFAFLKPKLWLRTNTDNTFCVSIKKTTNITVDFIAANSHTRYWKRVHGTLLFVRWHKVLCRVRRIKIVSGCYLLHIITVCNH